MYTVYKHTHFLCVFALMRASLNKVGGYTKQTKTLKKETKPNEKKVENQVKDK